MPSNSEYIILNGLLWDTEYVVNVVAENQKGKSQAASISFRTSTEPEAIPGTPFPQATPTKLQLKQEEKKKPSQSQTQSSKTTAPPSTYTSSALKGEWQLNRYAMKMHLGGEPEKIFRLNFVPLHFKVVTALPKWAWDCACTNGTGSCRRGRTHFLRVTVVLFTGKTAARGDSRPCANTPNKHAPIISD